MVSSDQRPTDGLCNQRGRLLFVLFPRAHRRAPRLTAIFSDFSTSTPKNQWKIKHPPPKLAAGAQVGPLSARNTEAAQETGLADSDIERGAGRQPSPQVFPPAPLSNSYPTYLSFSSQSGWTGQALRWYGPTMLLTVPLRGGPDLHADVAPICAPTATFGLSMRSMRSLRLNQPSRSASGLDPLHNPSGISVA